MSADRHSPHEVAGAYVAGRLDQAECQEFEEHLRGCEQCREEVVALGAVIDMVSVSRPAPQPPPDLLARVLEKVRAEPARGPSEFESATALTGVPAHTADTPSEDESLPPPVRFEPAVPQRRRIGGFRVAVAGLAAVLLLGLAVLAGTQIDSDDEEAPSGEIEAEATLVAAAGPGSAEAAVRNLGSGRVISLRSEDLEILPAGEFYELWFVGPGDSPAAPNRISAGTFHPDSEGVTDVDLHGAVDPEKFPRLEITAEPADGNPAPTGEIVLSAEASID